MAIQDKKIAKKRGRPATGTGRTVGVRVRPELSAQIEGWRAQQRPIPSEPEAIRRLVELGLTVKTSASPVDKPGRRMRARELATKAIEKIIDPSAPPEERAERRRRLTRGPAEFREDRVGLPKAKK